MNKTVLAVVIAVVLILGAYGAYRLLGQNNPVQTTPAVTSTESTAPTATTSTEATPATTSATTQTAVSIMNTGYTPQMITIKVGDTVTWTNNDTINHNVSSDPHPTHTLYPFLNLGMIPAGQSKSLMFDKPGTYTYHDHLHANLKGTVVVQ